MTNFDAASAWLKVRLPCRENPYGTGTEIQLPQNGHALVQLFTDAIEHGKELARAELAQEVMTLEETPSRERFDLLEIGD